MNAETTVGGNKSKDCQNITKPKPFHSGSFPSHEITLDILKNDKLHLIHLTNNTLLISTKAISHRQKLLVYLPKPHSTFSCELTVFIKTLRANQPDRCLNEQNW